MTQLPLSCASSKHVRLIGFAESSWLNVTPKGVLQARTGTTQSCQSFQECDCDCDCEYGVSVPDTHTPSRAIAGQPGRFSFLQISCVIRLAIEIKGRLMVISHIHGDMFTYQVNTRSGRLGDS